eukprot:13966-Chlamydomonas_euryale.AAC.5
MHAPSSHPQSPRTTVNSAAATTRRGQVAVAAVAGAGARGGRVWGRGAGDVSKVGWVFSFSLAAHPHVVAHDKIVTRVKSVAAPGRRARRPAPVAACTRRGCRNDGRRRPAGSGAAGLAAAVQARSASPATPARLVIGSRVGQGSVNGTSVDLSRLPPARPHPQACAATVSVADGGLSALLQGEAGRRVRLCDAWRRRWLRQIR